MKKRDTSFIERDYEGLKNELLILAKKYFPSTFQEFSEYSIETMLMELIAYTGDITNFYIDDRFRQNFLQYATDLESIYRISKSRGYKPQTVSVAYGNVEFSQLTGAKLNVNMDHVPDEDDCAVIKSGAIISDVSKSATFTTLESCDFKNYDRYEVVERTNNVPVKFRVYKKVKVRSGNVKTRQLDIGTPDKYPSFFIDNNVAFIIDISDSNGNHWYEVDFLSQDTIFEGIDIENHTEEYEQYKNQTPYILTTKKISRRFTTDHTTDGKCYIKFGSGVDGIDNKLRNLSSEDLLTTNDLSKITESETFSIENFLRSDSFGLIPTNTTLYVKYVKSNGNEENVSSNTITNIVHIIPTFSTAVSEEIRDSIEVNNDESILGGAFNNNIEKIRNESQEAFFTQKRCVTAKDYMIRSKMMPSKYGKISKVFVEKDHIHSGSKGVNIYVLSEDINGNLVLANKATKQNLINYLKEFKMASDRITVLDPFIINIGVDFKFMASSGYDNDEVLLNISRRVEEFLHHDNFELNQPIIVSKLIQEMDKAEGVVSITDLNIVNKYNEGEGYSNVKYDTSINGENYDNNKRILYPALDVSIFELRYPLEDITGKPI